MPTGELTITEMEVEYGGEVKVVCYLSRGLFNKQYMHLESRLRQTANVNLYQVAKSFLYLSFTFHYNYTEISGFTPALSIRLVLSCFLSARFLF